MQVLKRVVRWAAYSFGVLLIVSIFLNVWVVRSTASDVIRSVDQIDPQPVGLVLGTSNKTTSGHPNPFFENRIAAAAKLYHQKKIKRLIVSGDNQSSPFYNEPLQMKKALVALGVPPGAILVDDAGVRTLDSIVRCQAVFGESNVIIITQGFHAHRALFIGHYHHLHAQAFAATGIDLSSASARVYVREFFARAQAVLDLFVLHTQPVTLAR